MLLLTLSEDKLKVYQISQNSNFKKVSSSEDKKMIIEVKPLVIYEDIIITNLDALFECEIYREMKLEDNCSDGEKKIKIYSLLLFLRKRFEKIIGLEDEIAEILISESKNKREEKNETRIENKMSWLIEMGISESEIEEEKIKVSVFIKKLRKNFLVEIEDLKTILEEEFLVRRGKQDEMRRKEREEEKRKSQNYDEREIEKRIVEESLKLIIPPDTKFLF